MKTTDQIAAEAASQIDELYTNEEDNCVNKTIAIIKAAIEKAYEAGRTNVKEANAQHLWNLKQSRAAHASEVEEQAWHDGTMSPEVRATVDRAAHAGERP